jgi:hypothetical protein
VHRLNGGSVEWCHGILVDMICRKYIITDKLKLYTHHSTDHCDVPFNLTIYTLEHYYLAQGTMLHIHQLTTLVF